MGIESWLAHTSDDAAGPSGASDLDRARMAFAQRRARDVAAGENVDLFAEPAWDLMLALFIAYEEDRCVDVAAIEAVIGGSKAVNARWIATLVERALVATTDRQASRYVGLTDAGVAFMLHCLQAR